MMSLESNPRENSEAEARLEKRRVTIWKFPLQLLAVQTVQMPRGSKIIHVDFQDGGVMLWALVDPDKPHCSRRIDIAGTGHTLRHPTITEGVRDHIGSVLQNEGQFVWHVFDIGEE